ncbi:Rac GTPase-activating protein BCR/ABR [Diatrype stigma]|uniref:Rac GTPase-activating protein BCR/ABR n=1 Tax=Diatrype stigma TaxID=117547 RepID=A0AAN9UXN8_9PEZI
MNYTSEVESSISERNYGDNQTSSQIHSLASGQIASHVADITATLPLGKPQALTVLPTDAIARRFVDAYFRNVNRAYPFVNRTKVLNDLEIFGTLSQHSRSADSTLLYLIMAIGCTTLQRAGEIPPDTAASRFEIPYSDIIQECLCKEDIESLQILVLLALYSLFDPKSTSTWSIVGIVSRQAMLLGLTQRDPDEKALSAIDIELRRRLFWSIYVLDRMMASSLGMSPALVDNNLDVPLPGLTLEEFASCDRAYYTMILQTSRHVIQLRRLEDRILQQVHLNAMSPHTNRPTVLKDIRADIENWYSHGCLISPTEPDNVPIHNSITWLGARYYFLLILLYFPTQPSSEHTISQCELLRFTQKHLQLTSALFQQNQLPLNKVTLFRLFPVGVVMIHSYITSGTEIASSCPVRDEVATLLAIFEAFPESWKHAHLAADIFRQFLATVDTTPDLGAALRFPRSFATTQLEGSQGAHHRSVLRSLFSSLSALMQDALGKSSCYRIPNPAETMVSSFEMSLARQEPLFNPVSSSSNFHAAAYAASTGVNVNEEPMPDYEFRPLDLDFL